ncbi:phosphoadenosine phosphosulfate reductase family protein [Pelagicoccus sp. SDUM812003]|uniref:phosphoadenosine phosphosulfate reductase family protein n=1 Tax=Pelagicoccus sp. SDUM812003 TaxID=3041267 RepID=UPI00280C6EA0|nr:phosphoadenosine phosphosulfate reductase family protein [Pelagicoccus sp. SDUM812003]MDQ8203340.1 phosphoadenosine phosphosulfate reductase family protein [Pelagicoccus sp. SDUM812003]
MNPIEVSFNDGRPVRHVLNVSGGKDSSALALLMAGRVKGFEQFRMENMEYVFCDTQKELPETYQYLARLEAELGSKITYLNAKAGFDHWHKVFNGYLPSPQNRWCTKMLKLKPFEAHVGQDNVVSYVGLRADEDRVGYISKKPNIKTRYPLKEAGFDYDGVIQILEDSGLGLPTYMNWGRTNSGCTFCFFQTPYEWVKLYETYPKYFEQAMEYETIDPSDPNKQFTWMEKAPLSALLDPENRKRILEAGIRQVPTKGDNRLLSIFTGNSSQRSEACLMCQK